MEFTSLKPNHDKMTRMFFFCDIRLLRFRYILHDNPLILFTCGQVLVGKSHSINQLFGLPVFFQTKNKFLILSVLFLDTAGLIANC